MSGSEFDRASYERHSWPELEAAANRGAVVILPLGAIEQHGPHLPVVTDAYIARRLALAADQTHDVIVGPAMPLGYRSRPLTGGGPFFPGTISLSGATFTAVVREMIEEILRHGFRNIVLYLWHMENQNFAYEAAYLAASARQDVKVVIVETPFVALSNESMDLLYEGHFPGWGPEHAGLLETSLMLHLAPELVDMSRAVDDGAAFTPDYDIVPPPRSIASRSGALSRTRSARGATGERCFTEIVGHLQGILDTEFPRTRRHPDVIEQPAANGGPDEPDS